jgi:uncharacterized protein YegL
MASIDIILILDASGSMHHLINDTVGGINHFLESQRAEPGDAYVTLATFDSHVSERFAATPLRELAPLTVEGYYGGHGGSTALLDAVGRTILKYEKLPLKADKTMFVIDTDGEENASVEWTAEAVKASIERHQRDGWAFVFLGANNSEWQGRTIGAQSVGASVASGAGVRAKYANLDANTSAVRANPASPAAAVAAQSWDTGEGEKT